MVPSSSQPHRTQDAKAKIVEPQARRNALTAALLGTFALTFPHPDTAWCCSKSSVGFHFRKAEKSLLTVRGAKSFCWRGVASNDVFWFGRCTMRKHDFVANGFLAVTGLSFVLLCSGLLAIAFG
jgi:hypothetical protein